MSLLQFNVRANYDEVIRLRNEIENLETTLKNFGPGTAESTIRSLQIQLSQCRDQLQKLISEAATAGASLERTVNQSLANIRRNGNVNVSVNADTKEFHYRMLETDKDFQDVMKNLDTYTAKLSGFFSSLSSLAGFTAPLMGVLGFLNQVKETRTYFQDIESTMTVLLGSEEKSLEFCKQLQDAAYWNMFEYADLVGASKQMIAYGVATDQIIPKINQLSEVATATKGSLDEMVGMYNRAKAIGYIDSRALQTWASHGLVVKDVLKEMGEEVHGTKVTFEQLNRVLDHVTGEGGMFHNVMANQMSNISAEIGALEDNTSLMFNEIGEELQEPLTKVIKVAGMLVEHWKEVAGVLATAGTAYGIMRMARGADTAAFNAELDETKKKLEELHRERQKLVLDDDIQQGVDAGKYTREDAEKLQNNRNELKAAGADNKTLKQLEEEARQRIAVADAIEEEKAKLAELQQAQNQPQVKLDDDLQGMVNSGQASMEQVSELQAVRDATKELQAAKEAELATAQSELDFNDQLLESYQKDLASAQERKDKADELVASLQEQYDQQELLKEQYEQQGMSAEDAAAAVNEVVSASELEAAQREQAAAAAALEEAQKDANTAAEMRNAAAAEAEALSEEASALANGQASAAEATNTAATNANTGATNTNTAAQTKNTLATKLGAMADRAGATAKLILKKAVDSVKTSMHALKAAIISNPIGILITAITTVIGLFMAFKKESESASEEVERFGEAAVKTKNKTELLFAAIQATNKDSKTHKDAIAELEKQYKEYGIVLDADIDKEQQMIEKKAQLIQLIMEEGRQRQIANNIAAMQKQKEESIETFRKELTENINDETKDEQVKASTAVIVSSWLDKIEDKRDDLTKLISELDAKERELALELANQDYAKSAKLQAELTKARNELMSEMNADARKIMEAQGKKIGKDWQLDTNDAYQSLRKLVIETDAANKAMDGYVKNQQDNAAKLAQAAVPEKIDYTGKSVKDLTEALIKAQGEAKELKDTKLEPPADPVNIDALFESAQAAKDKLDEASNTEVAPDSDNTKIDETTDKATDAENKLIDVDNTTATPYIDTKYLDIALEKLNNIKITLTEVGGQVLNTTLSEKQQLKTLIDKYGTNGKIAAGTKMSKEDADLYNSIVKNARLRSNFKFGGTNYQLNGQQSAVLQQLIDRYGTSLSADKMDAGDARLYNQLKYDLRRGDIKAGGKKAADAEKGIRAEFDRQMTEAKTENQITQLTSDIRTQMKDLDPNTQLYKDLDAMVKKLDKKNPSKKNKKSGKKDDPKQRAYDEAKLKKEEEERLAKQERKRLIEEEEFRISMMKDGTEKEIAQIHLDARKKREALEDERKKEADRLKSLDLQLWLKGGKDRKAYDWKPTKTDEEYLQLASDILGVETSLSEIAYNESTALQVQYRNDLVAMRDYLKEYGTFEQRKLAITQEYEEKIREASSPGEKFKLEQEQATALEGVEMEALKSQIDWYSVFDNVGLIMKGQLEPLYKRLQEYVKTDAFKTSDASSQHEIIEAMENIRQQVGASQGWKDLSTALTDYQAALLALKQAEEENTEVMRKQSELQRAYNDADAKLKTLTGQDYEAIAKAQADLDAAKESGDADAIRQAEDILNALVQLGDATEIQSALDALAKARKDLNNYSQTVADSSQAVADANANVSGTGMQLSQTTKNVTQPISEIYTFLNNYGLPQLAELWHQFDLIKGGLDGLKALKDAGKEAADVGKEISDAGKKVDEGANAAAKKLNDVLPKEFIEGLDSAGLIGQLVSAVMSILEILGDGIGTFISNIIDTVLSNITGILDNLLSGEFAIQIGESLVKGIGGIFKSITTMGGLFDWWGNGESDPKLEEDIERLTLTNEALRKAIEDLTDEMKDASITDAANLYQQAKSNYEASTKNTQEMMSRAGAAYSNGFLGFGGHHSSNNKINNGMTAADWNRISKAAGASVKSASDFWNLTSEQMAKVAKETPDLYAKIKGLADDGYKDAAQFMDEYIEYWKELEELRNAYWQSLTDTNFDSVKDAFKSTLLDMESSTEDFAQSFEAMMRQAVINSLMTSKYNKLLEDWYEEFAKAMEGDGLSDDEQRRLKKKYDAIVSDAIADREAVAKAMGWDTSTTQQASSRALQGMTQDTAEAIEGRMTAMQIAVETIRATHQIEAASIAELNDSMLAMLQTEKGYAIFYENLERQVAKIYLEVQGINENTGAIVKPIQTMQTSMENIERKLKTL